MSLFHHRRGCAFVTAGCPQIIGLIVALVCAPVLIRTLQQLDPDHPAKPKPGVVRSYKGTERPPTKSSQPDVALLAPSPISVDPGFNVFIRPPFDTLLVGARIVAQSPALRAPPSPFSA
jgi:hypothetical protein